MSIITYSANYNKKGFVMLKWRNAELLQEPKMVVAAAFFAAFLFKVMSCSE